MKHYLRLFVCFFVCCVSALSADEFVPLPPPDLEVNIPMRDGALLPTAFYFPNHEKGKCPCVLLRHPLGDDKTHVYLHWKKLLDAGYTVVVQPTRSSCDKSGKMLPYLTDCIDGHDTVEWLAQSEYSNGKVATVGMSAAGITQLLMAPSAPKHLQCQFIEVAAPSLYDYVVCPGGSFRKELVEGWLTMHKRDPSVFECLHTNTEYDGFWQQFNSLDKVEQVAAPQVLYGGWYDIFLQGTIDNFVATQNKTSKVSSQHKLIIGPWDHRWQFYNVFGDFTPIAEGKQPPHPVTMVAWFDYYLKGIDSGISKVPAVQYYVMGPMDGTPSKGNCWRCAHKWPPPAAYMNFYLTSENQLVPEISSEVKFTNLSFSPDNPVPTVGGRNLFIPAGPKDLSSIEARDDVLAFTTSPLDADVEVTGRVFGTFSVQNIGNDRDLCCRISDVYPNGKSVLISEGACRIQQSKGKEQTVVVDFWSTSMVFAKNHKIRLTVSASNFPAQEMHLKPNADGSPISFALCTGGKKNCYIALPLIQHYDLPTVTICSNKEKVAEQR